VGLHAESVEFFCCNKQAMSKAERERYAVWPERIEAAVEEASALENG
jgi:hypothetical protein